MKLVLCDDVKDVHEEVKSLINIYQEVKRIDIDIVDCLSSKDLLDIDYSYDAILLDIDMPEIDGIEAARILRERNNNTTIVMLTCKRERFKDAFKIGAVRFITKPIDKDEVFEALDYVVLSLAGQEMVDVRVNGIACKIKQRDIWLVEARSDYLKIYAGQKVYDSRKRLNNLECELDERLFIATHKSYIVNMMYVSEITKSGVIMDDGRKIPIARRRYKDVVQKIIEFDRTRGC